jgi:hypothetical protein
VCLDYSKQIGLIVERNVLNALAPTEDKSDDSMDSLCEELEQVFDHFPKYHMKILLGDFNAKLGREDTLKLTIGNESLHEDSNGNGVRVVNFATSINLVAKSTMFPQPNIRKYTWTSPDGKTHSQIDHVLIDRRWHSSILDVRSFRGADCDTDHYLVVAEVRERLAVSKQAAQKFLLLLLLLLLFTAIGFSPGGSSPYTSTHNTNVFTLWQ